MSQHTAKNTVTRIAGDDKHAANRRVLLTAIGVTGATAAAVPNHWLTPLIQSVVLPAHAQTSCVTDSVVGGPLIGNPSGATTCQAACEAEAAAQNANLCAVEETQDAQGATQCGCSLDLPE